MIIDLGVRIGVTKLDSLKEIITKPCAIVYICMMIDKEQSYIFI